MLKKAGCALLCLPFLIWIFCMLLYAALPHAVFWALTILLGIGVVALVVRVGRA